jgi:hypothetical protein
LRDLFRAPINLLGFRSKRHAMLGLFLTDSDLNSLFALPQNQLQEIAQLRISLSPFRSAGGKDFTYGFLAFEFPNSHSVSAPLLIRRYKFCHNWPGRFSQIFEPLSQAPERFLRVFMTA